MGPDVPEENAYDEAGPPRRQYSYKATVVGLVVAYDEKDARELIEYDLRKAGKLVIEELKYEGNLKAASWFGPSEMATDEDSP